MNTETKGHTPGPYLVVRRDVILNGFAVHSSIEVGSFEGSRVVALIMDCEEGQANADFYAAAPETAAERDRLLELKDVYESLVLAVQEYVVFSPSNIGMPHMGSEAWQASRDRVMRLIDPAWTVAHATEGG